MLSSACIGSMQPCGAVPTLTVCQPGSWPITRCGRGWPAWAWSGGNLANRFGLEVRYSAAELEFRTGGDGSALGMLRVDHRFDVREVGVQVGYIGSF